jgi:DNA-binding HxlR family transcriptional regulator
LNQSPVASDPDIESFRADALNCPLPPSIELIGERWSFLILRGTFNGLRHFEQFQAALGIARNILSNRLARLVEGGILERRPDPTDRRKVIYSLTLKGEALLPVLIALRQWGQDWARQKGDRAGGQARRHPGEENPRSGLRRARPQAKRADVVQSRNRKADQRLHAQMRKGGPSGPPFHCSTGKGAYS